MRPPGWRWCVVVTLVGVLVSLPAAVGALPVAEPQISALTLLERVRTSDRVAWSGKGEARGDLVLADLSAFEDLPDLISGTTRVRAWWRGPADHRVDALGLTGEADLVVRDGRTWTWESQERLATASSGGAGVRLPRAADLVAPTLGARLSRGTDVEVEARPARRVAGVDAAGLRLRPRDPATTTVERVDLWVEPDTGLTVQVEVHARDVEQAALTSLLLDLDLTAPPAARTAFRPPADARVQVVDAPDLAAAAARYSPYRLPDTLAGLTRRRDVGAQTGVATYGEGLTALTVIPLRGRTAARLLRSLDSDDVRADEAQVSTALVQGRVARQGRRGYLLLGTVPQDVLSSGLTALHRDPPPERRS